MRFREDVPSWEDQCVKIMTEALRGPVSEEEIDDIEILLDHLGVVEWEIYRTKYNIGRLIEAKRLMLRAVVDPPSEAVAAD